MKMADQCKGHGIKGNIISSAVATGRVNTDILIHFNQSLKNLCRANGFCFVNNSNISEEKRILANNFINGINNNNFLLKHSENNHF